MLAPLGEAAAGQSDNTGPEDALQIDTFMCPETGILDSDKGINQVLRQLIVSDQTSVRALADQCLDLIAAGIVDGGGQPFRGYVQVTHVRGFIQDAHNCAVQAEACDRDRENNGNKKKLEQNQDGFCPYFLRVGLGAVQLLHKSFLTEIHKFDSPYCTDNCG